MLAAGWIAAALTLVPFEPHIDCVTGAYTPVYTEIYVTNGQDISWNGQKITHQKLREYIRQTRELQEERKPEDRERDVFMILRDDLSVKEALEIASEISDAGLPSGDNCLRIP